MNHDENPMEGHEVDGIQELDNRLPRWWVWLFNITIIFSVVYVLYFDVLKIGDSQAAQYDKEIARARGESATAVATTGVNFDEPSTDPKVLARGRALYNANCAVCHAADGGGGIGPNMTDDYFIHGPTFADKMHIIREGVPAKGMISWKTQMRPADIHAVASYVHTLRGTTPAQAKAPEGIKAEG